ncbi:unnamed protein product [Ixodes pacificus]
MHASILIHHIKVEISKSIEVQSLPNSSDFIMFKEPTYP